MVKDLLKKFVSKWSLEYSEQSLLWFYVGNFNVPFENGAKSEKNCSKCSKSAVFGVKMTSKGQNGENFWGKSVST